MRFLGWLWLYEHHPDLALAMLGGGSLLALVVIAVVFVQGRR